MNTPAKPVWGTWATAGFGAVILTAFIFIQAFVMGVFVFLKVISGSAFDLSRLGEVFSNNLGLVVSLSTVISGAFGIALIIVFIKARGGATIKEYLGLKPVSVKAIMFGLAITLGLIVLAGVLASVFKIPPDDEFVGDIYHTSIWPPLLWVALVVFAPAFEESLFRGFLFIGLRRSKIGVAGAIVITALLWAILHIQYGFYGLGVVFAMGILLGIMRFKTDSLFAPVTMHAFFNLVALLALAAGAG